MESSPAIHRWVDCPKENKVPEGRMSPAAGRSANAVLGRPSLERPGYPRIAPSGAETRSVEGFPALHQGPDRSHLEIHVRPFRARVCSAPRVTPGCALGHDNAPLRVAWAWRRGVPGGARGQSTPGPPGQTWRPGLPTTAPPAPTGHPRPPHQPRSAGLRRAALIAGRSGRAVRPPGLSRSLQGCIRVWTGANCRFRREASGRHPAGTDSRTPGRSHSHLRTSKTRFIIQHKTTSQN